MRVSVGMNARLPLRSPLPHNRLSSLHAGLFVVKLNARHTHTNVHTQGQLCLWFYWHPTLVTGQEREVLNKRAKECVCVTGGLFFCHLKHVHSPLSLWLFWTHGWSVGALLTLPSDDPHTPCPSSVWTSNIWFSGDFHETNICLSKGWITLLVRTRLASLKPDSCLCHFQQKLMAMETFRRKCGKTYIYISFFFNGPLHLF